MATPIAAPQDIPTDQMFQEYFIKKGMIRIQSLMSFPQIKKQIFKTLRGLNCWIYSTNMHCGVEVTAVGWYKKSVSRFFDVQ
jgi:hypothetical protein